MCAAINYDGVKVDFYELQTLPKSGFTSTSINKVESPVRMATNSPQKREKKSSLTIKERLFGMKSKPRKGSANDKYDVIRTPDIADHVKARKEAKKDAYGFAHTSYIRGHMLEPHTKTSWCDSCEELIWGLNIQAVRCQYCRYTCHSKCVSDVFLDCPKAPTTEKSREEITKETLEILGESLGGSRMMNDANNNLPRYVSSITELRRLIDEYNDKSTLIMTLHNDCTFDGFIRVHMNLNRPVNVSTDVSNLTLKKAVAKHKASRARARVTSSSFRRPVSEIFPSVDDKSGSTSSSSYDSGIGSSYGNDSGVAIQQTSPPLSPADTAVLSSVYSRRKLRRKLSFYMPKGTYKPLHVTSTTTVKEVIEALLAKYNVTDNPKKYVLFIKEQRQIENDEEEVIYTRLHDDEQPLVLLLSWGPLNSTHTFALKEDEDENLQWMNFEPPELDNFLRILQLEEDHLLAQIFHKYEEYRVALQRALDAKSVSL